MTSVDEIVAKLTEMGVVHDQVREGDDTIIDAYTDKSHVATTKMALHNLGPHNEHQVRPLEAWAYQYVAPDGTPEKGPYVTVNLFRTTAPVDLHR